MNWLLCVVLFPLSLSAVEWITPKDSRFCDDEKVLAYTQVRYEDTCPLGVKMEAPESLKKDRSFPIDELSFYLYSVDPQSQKCAYCAIYLELDLGFHYTNSNRFKLCPTNIDARAILFPPILEKKDNTAIVYSEPAEYFDPEIPPSDYARIRQEKSDLERQVREELIRYDKGDAVSEFFRSLTLDQFRNSENYKQASIFRSCSCSTFED